jgi:hypothetical protein
MSCASGVRPSRHCLKDDWIKNREGSIPADGRSCSTTDRREKFNVCPAAAWGIGYREVGNIFANANMLATQRLAQNRVPAPKSYFLRASTYRPPVHKLQLLIMPGGNRGNPGSRPHLSSNRGNVGFFWTTSVALPIGKINSQRGSRNG